MSETNAPQPAEKTAAAEIQELERLLAEKKKALAETGTVQPEKETFREVFREKFSETPASSTPAAAQQSAQRPSDDTLKKAADFKTKEREEQLGALIELAFEKGVLEAVSLARAMTPWLLDELHDKLADEYYDKLIQSRT